MSKHILDTDTCPVCGSSWIELEQEFPLKTITTFSLPGTERFRMALCCTKCGRFVAGVCIHGNSLEQRKCYDAIHRRFFSRNHGGKKLTKYIIEYNKGNLKT